LRITFDPAKNACNVLERGLPFELVAAFDFDAAMIAQDDRHQDERRMIAIGPFLGRLHVVVYVMRGDVRRVISFRRANARERRRYDR